MEEHNGDSPKNARININYTGKKPKVKFSYPDKPRQMEGSMYLAIVMLCMIVFALLLYGYQFGKTNLDTDYADTDLKDFAECVAMHPIKTLTNYSGVRYDICEPDDKMFFPITIPLFVAIFAIGILPGLIYWPFRKKWNKLYPDYQAFTARKKYRKFNKKDIEKDKEGKYYIEIPSFNNIICDFKATKDFSKHLDEFSIREHRFYSYRPKLIQKISLKFWKKQKKVKRRMINEFIWYARWYFKEKPKSGYLEVIFK